MGWKGPMTHRQFQAWIIWMSEEWNKPAKIDYYLAQIAKEAARMTLKDPGKAETNNYLIKFVDPTAHRDRVQQQSVDASKANWLAAVGAEDPNKPKIQIVHISPSEAVKKYAATVDELAQ